MKRKLFAVMAVVLCFSALVSCGQKQLEGGKEAEKKETLPLTVGTKNQVEGYAEFTLFKLATTKKITAAMTATGLYYENKTDGYTFVDAVFDFTNSAAEAVSCGKMMTMKASGANGEEYGDVMYAVEADGMTTISRSEDIAPLATARLHCALSVPETESKLTLTFDVNGTAYTCEYTLNELVRNAQALAAGQTLEAKDYATLVFKGIEYTDDLLPPDTSGFYTHYNVKNSANTYLVAKFDVTNQQSTAQKANTFVSASARYQDKYTYTGGLLVEDTDGKGFDQYEEIAPLNTRHVYYLIEVPKTMSQNPVELTVNFNGQEFLFTGK